MLSVLATQKYVTKLRSQEETFGGDRYVCGIDCGNGISKLNTS